MDLSVSDQSVIISFFQMEIYLQKVAFGIRKKVQQEVAKICKRLSVKSTRCKYIGWKFKWWKPAESSTCKMAGKKYQTSDPG